MRFVMRVVLLFLALFDVTLTAWAGARPDLWFKAFHEAASRCRLLRRRALDRTPSVQRKRRRSSRMRRNPPPW
jgi:hypothetical protein